MSVSYVMHYGVVIQGNRETMEKIPGVVQAVAEKGQDSWSASEYSSWGDTFGAAARNAMEEGGNPLIIQCSEVEEGDGSHGIFENFLSALDEQLPELDIFLSAVYEDCEYTGGFLENFLISTAGESRLNLSDFVGFDRRWDNFDKIHADHLTSITLPAGLRTLQGIMLYECKNLTSVVFPDSLEEIGNFALFNCKCLVQVTLPEGLKKIGWCAFSGCPALETIRIPKSVKKIDGSAFSQCTGLREVILPKGLKTIGESAFRGCTSLENISIPDGVKTSGRNPFEGNPWVKEPVILNGTLVALPAMEGAYTIPEGVTKIGGGVFSGCTGLTSVTIPEGVTAIGKYAFYGCNSLTHVDFPKSLMKIETAAFENCTALTQLMLPEGLTELGAEVFSGCTGLTCVTIPQGVTKIPSKAFAACKGLSSAVLHAGVANIAKNAFPGGKNKKVVLHVPAGSFAESFALKNNYPCKNQEC